MVKELSPSSVPAVAALMARIKPDWWDEEGARRQLEEVSDLAKLAGWYMEEDGRPVGWILCGVFEGYSYLSIECLGYDEKGRFVMEGQLEPLLRKAEEYARQKGLRGMKYVISSTGMSCHGRPLGDYAQELGALESYGREHFDYFRQYGFVPTGFLPHCYGENYHGIIMVKCLLREENVSSADIGRSPEA